MNSTIFSFFIRNFDEQKHFLQFALISCVSILDVIMNISDPPLARFHSALLSYVLGSPFAVFLILLISSFCPL